MRPKTELKIGAKAKDEAELDRIYELGRITAHERLSEVKEFLNAGGKK